MATNKRPKIWLYQRRTRAEMPFIKLRENAPHILRDAFPEATDEGEKALTAKDV